MAAQEAELMKTPIIVPAAPRVPTVEVKEQPPHTVLSDSEGWSTSLFTDVDRAT